MTRLSAVVFDLDDTLYLERDYVRSGFRAVAGWAARSLGVPEDLTLAELLELFEGGERAGTFDRWLDERGRASAVGPSMVAVYREHAPRIKPHPAAASVLAGLRARVGVGLLTDGEACRQRSKLDALGLAGMFDAAVFTGDLGPTGWKPNPRGYEEVLLRLGVAGQEAVYVADNPAKDFLGARRASMRSIRVRDPRGLHAGVEAPNAAQAPDREIADLSHVEEALAAL